MTNDTPQPENPPAAPVVREKRSWAMPLIVGLAVVASLAVGGIGGYAIASATGPGNRPGIEQAGAPHGPFADRRDAPRDDRGPRPGPGDGEHRPGGDRPSDEADGAESDDAEG